MPQIKKMSKLVLNYAVERHNRTTRALSRYKVQDDGGIKK